MAKTINVFVLSLFKNLEHIAVINERLHEIPRFFLYLLLTGCLVKQSNEVFFCGTV